MLNLGIPPNCKHVLSEAGHPHQASSQQPTSRVEFELANREFWHEVRVKSDLPYANVYDIFPSEYGPSALCFKFLIGCMVVVGIFSD